MMLAHHRITLPVRVTWRVEELAAQRGWGVSRLAEEASLDQKTVRNILAGRATRVDLNTGRAQPGELEAVLAGSWSEESDPALERALRSH